MVERETQPQDLASARGGPHCAGVATAVAKSKPKPLRRAPIKRQRGRIVVEVRSESEGVYQRELVKCGKAKCGRCRRKPAHGPYWYLYQWQPSTRTREGRLRSVYVGKELVRRVG